jgi:hypothetical protein
MLILIRNSEIYALDIREVIARGRRLVIDGACKVRAKFLEKSTRNVTLIGEKSTEPVHTAGRT